MKKKMAEKEKKNACRSFFLFLSNKHVECMGRKDRMGGNLFHVYGKCNVLRESSAENENAEQDQWNVQP